MGSISLSNVYAHDGRSWAGYGTPAPDNLLIGDYWYVTYDTFFGPISDYSAEKRGTWQHLYALNVTTGTAETLQSITLRLNFWSGSYDPDVYTGTGQHNAIATCYVYNTDPRGSDSPPSGYIGSGTQTVTLSKDGGTQTASFSINTPNAASTLYVWVTLYVSWPVGYVDGYNVYCAHQCTYYDVVGNFQPLVLSFDLAENGASIQTGTGHADLNFTIYNASGIALILSLSYGGEVFHTYSISASTGNPRQYFKTVQPSWFDEAGVTHLKSMTITFSLESADGTMTATGTRYATIVAGNDMKPDVASLSLDVVQPASVDPSYAGVWIAGVSRATYRVMAEPTTYAEITGVTMTCPDGTTVPMTYTGSNYVYTATLPAPVTGTGTVKATAVDQRGMSATTSMGIRNVVPYTVPTVGLQSLYRCDSGGTESDGGEYYSIRVVPEIYKPESGTMSDNAVTSLTSQVGASGGQRNLTPDVTTLIGPVLTNPDSAYTILVSVRDRVGVTTVREFLLTGAHHDFVLRYSNGHTHLGIGMAPEVSGLSCDTIQLPAGGKVIIGGTVKLS